MTYLLLKAAISGVLVALAAEAARRSPGVGGLIASLPLVSILAIIAFVSAISAMMMVGPHIASSMANDKLLPKFFAERDGRPPVGSVLFQGGVAVALLWSHSVSAALKNVGAISGTGLGLAILKRSVDRHGGSVSYESEEGKGTKFSVTLPVSFNPGSQSAAD